MKNSTQSLMPRGGTQANENRRSGFPSGATTQYLPLYFSATYAYFQDRDTERKRRGEDQNKIMFSVSLCLCVEIFS